MKNLHQSVAKLNDSLLKLPVTAFVDTHHLRFSSVAPVTAELTQRAVLPRLAGL